MDISLHDCVYCGMRAQGRDHVIPHSYNSDRQDNRTFGVDEVVPACRECNSLLSNSFIPSIAERAMFISRRLQQRFRKQLGAPDWSVEDLNSLGRRLRSKVRRLQQQKKIALLRIGHAEGMSLNTYLTPLEYWASVSHCEQTSQNDLTK